MQRWIGLCAEHCERHGYNVVHTEIGGVDRHWPSLARWLLEGRAEVIVTARRDHLPATRTPRVEVVSEHAVATVGAVAVRRRVRRVAR